MKHAQNTESHPVSQEQYHLRGHALRHGLCLEEADHPYTKISIAISFSTYGPESVCLKAMSPGSKGTGYDARRPSARVTHIASAPARHPRSGPDTSLMSEVALRTPGEAEGIRNLVAR